MEKNITLSLTLFNIEHQHQKLQPNLTEILWFSDETNCDNLELIQRSLAIICMDEPLPPSFNYRILRDNARGHKVGNRDETNMLHQMIHGGGSTFNSGNRWFDKTTQVRYLAIHRRAQKLWVWLFILHSWCWAATERGVCATSTRRPRGWPWSSWWSNCWRRPKNLSTTLQRLCQRRNLFSGSLAALCTITSTTRLTMLTGRLGTKGAIPENLGLHSRKNTIHFLPYQRHIF